MTSPLVTTYRVTDVHAVRYRTIFSAETALAHARRARDEGRDVAAEVWLKRAQSRSRRGTSTHRRAALGLARLYLSVGRPRGALVVLAAVDAQRDPAVVDHLQARAHHALAAFDEAEALYQRALRTLWGRTEKSAHRAMLLHDLAICWDDMGQTHRAEMTLRTVARALDRFDRPRAQAASLLELGLIVRGRNLEEAAKHIERALFLSEQHQDRRLTRDALTALADVHGRLGARRSALLLRLRAAALLDPEEGPKAP